MKLLHSELSLDRIIHLCSFQKVRLQNLLAITYTFFQFSLVCRVVRRTFLLLRALRSFESLNALTRNNCLPVLRFGSLCYNLARVSEHNILLLLQAMAYVVLFFFLFLLLLLLLFFLLFFRIKFALEADALGSSIF